jgi:HTH-type transcriptional regulator / antitoxin HipB
MKQRMGALPETLRERLQTARREKGMSQAALGQIVGLPQAHISGIESGRIVPRFDTLLDLVRVLDFDLVLVPREMVGMVEGLVRHANGEEERPLYEPDGEEEDGEEAEERVR